MNFLNKLRIKYNKIRNKIPQMIVDHILLQLDADAIKGKKFYKVRIDSLERQIKFSLESIYMGIMQEVEEKLKEIGIKTIVKKHESVYYFDEYKFYWE